MALYSDGPVWIDGTSMSSSLLLLLLLLMFVDGVIVVVAVGTHLMTNMLQ